jgi:Mn2+/Fe2+ NRAMP family transporter
VWLTRDKSVLGVDINTTLTTVLAIVGATFVIVLNLLLLWVTFIG